MGNRHLAECQVVGTGCIEGAVGGTACLEISCFVKFHSCSDLGKLSWTDKIVDRIQVTGNIYSTTTTDSP